MATDSEFCGQADCGFHAVGTGDATTGDVEGRAVIGARSDKGKSERDIYPIMEGVELERDKALVVIHAKDAIELALHGAVENGIRRKRALEVAVTLQVCNGWRDDLDFLEAEVAIFSSVGIQTSDGDAGFSNTSGTKEVREEISDSDDLGGCEKSRNACEWNMGRDQRDGECAAGEAHGEIFDPGSAGEKLGLTWKIKSNLMHGALADRPGDDRLPMACGELLGGDFQGDESFLGGCARGTTRRVFLRKT